MKYTAEDFNLELQKMLNEDDDEDNLCLISSLPLTDKYVTLECNHKFNYEPLYREIYTQKYEFKTYDYSSLNGNNLIKYKLAQQDYYIKCPYCRNIQFSILPYYEELGLKKCYGINSLDRNLPNSIFNVLPSMKQKVDLNWALKYGQTVNTGVCNHKYSNFLLLCK